MSPSRLPLVIPFDHNFPTAAQLIAARSAAKKILGVGAGVRSEIRYFARAFAGFFPTSGPRVEIQLVRALVFHALQ